MTGIYVLLGLIVALCGFIAWHSATRRPEGDTRLASDLERRDREIGELKSQLSELKSAMDRKSGEGKQLYAENVHLKAETGALRKELNRYESEEKVREREKVRAINELTEAKNSLEEEKLRLRREDAERRERELRERDRLWAEHELRVIAQLQDLCRKPQLGFACFDNTNLPDGFDGSLKPDFMIECLGQYVIFDAKVSRSQDLQSYLKSAVQATAKKVKKRKEIYPTVFFVVPTEAAKELTTSAFYEEGFHFYVVPPEALESILASLKKLETYEFAQEMNPQERENLVDIIAHLDFHISSRNAIDYRLLEHGVEMLEKIRGADSEFIREVMVKREKIRNLNFNTSDVKQLTTNPDALQQKLTELTEPRARMRKKEIGTIS